MGGVDADFDPIAEAFERDLYGSTKGRVRLEILWRDLLAEVPQLQGGGLRVLDAGGGAGHLALRLAALGNKVLLCDPSTEMLRMAREEVRQRGLGNRVNTVRCAIQKLASITDERFDLVTCHAVLEWLAQPREALAHLVQFLNTDGRLSLMFYNSNAALFKRMLRGDFAAIRDHPTGIREGETAPVALDEASVTDWLTELGLHVTSRSGIRILHDHLRAELDDAGVEQLTEAETDLRKREPFASLAQHIHLVCEFAEA